MGPRRPWLAALLNFLVSGSGHFYIGRAGRGIGITICAYGIYAALGLFGLISNFRYFWIAIAGAIAIKLFLMADAYCIARRTPLPSERFYMKASFYILYVVILGGSVYLYAGAIDTFLGYRAFNLPGNSMAPTLVKSDYILVDTHYYRYHPLAVGDVVVLDDGKGHQHIRRILTLGDKIQMVADNPEQHPNIIDVMPENIGGRVTSIYFSPNFSRIGREVNQPLESP